MGNHMHSGEQQTESHANNGVEHIPDSTFVIPIIDLRSLLRLKQGLKSVAMQMDAWEQIEDHLVKLFADIEHLRSLAVLSRYTLLGDRCARSTLQLELELLISQTGRNEKRRPIAKDAAQEENCSGVTAPVVNLTALFDVLLAAFLIYRNNHKLFEKLKQSVYDRLRETLGIPLFYADKAGESVGTKGAIPASEPARAALVGLVRTLCENGPVALPLPRSCERQIDRIINFWARPNIVQAVMEMIDANTLPIDSLSSATAEIKQRLNIKLARECRLPKEDLMVLLEPAYYRANVLTFVDNTIGIEVPPAPEHSRVLVLSRPRADTLNKLTELNEQVRAALPEIWGTSALGMIPFNHWSYPSFTDEAVDVTVYPPVDSVELKIFDASGTEVKNRRLVIGKTYRLQVLPPEGNKNPRFTHRVEFSLGETQPGEGHVTLIRPAKVGRGTVSIRLPRTDRVFDVDAIPDVPGLSDLIDGIVRRECGGHPDEEACRVLGRWDPVIENALSIVGVHAVVLHTGKVLFYAFDHRTVNNTENLKKYFSNPNLGSYQIWDPETGHAEPVKPVGRNVFCAGQCLLPNGHVLVVGGQDGAGAVELTEEWDKWLAAGGTLTFWIPGLDTNNGSSKDVHTYDPVNDSWSRWPDMEENRYYPTCEILPNGNAIVVAGLSNLQRFIASGSNWNQVDYYETFDMDRLGEGALSRGHFRSADQYPIIRLLPGSNLMFVHIHNTTRLFDVVTKQWVPEAEFYPPEPVGRWTYPMQTGHVLLPQHEGDSPRLFISGGSEETNFDYNTRSNARAVQRGYIFEFDKDNVANSRWRETIGRPHVARLLNDHVLLPDGTVFIVNGISGGASSGHNQAPVLVCEIFDPVTETFTQVAAPDERHPRGYHATAFLLPDGRVAVAGHTKTYNQPVMPDDTSIQIYNPPYLCNGPRPVIAGVAESYDYGQMISGASPGHRITKAIMIRPSGVTHTVDMSQRGIWLAVEQTDDQVRFPLPTDRSLALPGYYMLFFLNENAVPSLAHWIHIGREYYPGATETGCPDDYVHEDPVHLGTIENHRTVDIVRNGDIFIRKIDQHCNVKATSRCGSIYIEEKIDQHCWVRLSARHNVLIGEKADQHCIVNIDCGGDVTFGWRNAGEGKVDQHCQVNVRSLHGNLSFTKKIDANSAVYARVDEGNITIREKVDGHSVCTLYAPNGDIEIGEKVGGGAQVHWQAINFRCPDTSGGEVDRM
jgi:hypothetical protein